MAIPFRLTLVALAAILGQAAPAAARQLEPPPVETPAIAAHDASAEGFAPAGWRVEYRASGDLNGDGHADLALVLRDEDPRNILKNADGFGPDPFDTNPRLLVIAFAAPGGGYDLAATDDRLIPRPDNASQEDVLADAESPSISRGALHIQLHLFMSAGGWGMGNCTFAFRWEQGRFRLIGYDATWVTRNTGAADDISVNYLTGAVIRSKGSIESDKARRTTSRLRSTAPIWLGDITDGLSFEESAGL